MIPLKEVSLSVLVFQLVEDADKTPEENNKSKEEFKQRFENLTQEAETAGLSCTHSLLPVHDSEVATLIVSKEQLKDLEDLKELTLGGKLLDFQGNIGQTVVLFGQPQEDSDLKKLAKDCYEGLGLTKTEDFYLRPGELLGSPIYEYQPYGEPCGHLWFWFDSNPLTQTQTQIQEKWTELRKLLLYRSKVLSAYKEAKAASQEANELHLQLKRVCESAQGAIENKGILGTPLEQRQQELENLKEQLKEISQIGFNLFEEIRFSRYSSNGIKINSANYLTSLKELGSPVFLTQFYHQSQKQFLPQVASDLNYITPSYDLANQTIATIRGYVAIEQARCEQEAQDRDILLQDTVEAVSIALGAVAIIASFAGMLEKPLCIPIRRECSPHLHPFIAWVVSSLFLAWLFYQIVLKIKRRKRR